MSLPPAGGPVTTNPPNPNPGGPGPLNPPTVPCTEPVLPIEEAPEVDVD
jgi:hypothetical protein